MLVEPQLEAIVHVIVICKRDAEGSPLRLKGMLCTSDAPKVCVDVALSWEEGIEDSSVVAEVHGHAMA